MIIPPHPKVKKYIVGLTQMAIGPDGNDNLKRAVQFVTAAAKEGAQIVCLPELYRSQYFCQKEDIDYYDLAESADGESVKVFRKLAAKLKVSVIVPFFERHAPGLYFNSAAVIENDGSLLGIYRKMHIPDDPAYYEKFYFTPGDKGFMCFDTKAGKIGTLICWDQWYPEGARITSLLGAETLFYPTAIGWHPYEKEEHGGPQRDSWITIQRSHAIANGAYVCSVNRVGFEQPEKEQPGIQFWGSSFIADPQGIIIAQASDDKEEILLAEIDPGRVEYIRRNWPFLRDRRVDAYSGITKRFLG